jgi:hypothetical protein
MHHHCPGADSLTLNILLTLRFLCLNLILQIVKIPTVLSIYTSILADRYLVLARSAIGYLQHVLPGHRAVRRLPVSLSFNHLIKIVLMFGLVAYTTNMPLMPAEIMGNEAIRSLKRLC